MGHSTEHGVVLAPRTVSDVVSAAFDPADANARRSAVRPTPQQYFMLLAVATRERAACLRRHVGAILVSDQRIIATGYNGTPTGFPNCDEGGCHRCSHPEDYAEGRG